jgi:hypothetical protein
MTFANPLEYVANIVEAFRKCRSPDTFGSKLTDSGPGETEIHAWLDFARGRGELNENRY